MLIVAPLEFEPSGTKLTPWRSNHRLTWLMNRRSEDFAHNASRNNMTLSTLVPWANRSS